MFGEFFIIFQSVKFQKIQKKIIHGPYGYETLWEASLGDIFNPFEGLRCIPGGRVASGHVQHGKA